MRFDELRFVFWDTIAISFLWGGTYKSPSCQLSIIFHVLISAHWTVGSCTIKETKKDFCANKHFPVFCQTGDQTKSKTHMNPGVAFLSCNVCQSNDSDRGYD